MPVTLPGSVISPALAVPVLNARMTDPVAVSCPKPDKVTVITNTGLASNVPEPVSAGVTVTDGVTRKILGGGGSPGLGG